MNCVNCNNPLTPGNNVCPTCGALNMPLPTSSEVTANVSDIEQTINTPPVEEEVQSLEVLEGLDEPSVTITENMAAPTLDIESENLTEGVVDISNANISTYAPEEVKKEAEEQEEIRELEQNRVDFAIPAVQTPVVQENVTFDENGVPIVDANGVIEQKEEAPKAKIKMPALKIPKSIKIGNKDIKIPDINGGKPVPMNMVIAGLVVVFIVGLIAGKSFFSKSVYIPGTMSNRDESDIILVADGKNNITKAGAYTYTIPMDYIYDRRDGGVAILDKKDTFRLFLKAIPGSYDDLANAKTSVIETIKEQGVQLITYKETLINKKNYIVVESTIGMTNRLLAFTDAKNDYVFYIEIVNFTNTYDYNILDLADDIIRNVKYNQDESDMEMIPTNDISEVVVKASQEYKQLTN